MAEDDRQQITISEAQAGLRLDKALAELLPGASRAEVRRLLEAGAVRVGGRVCRKKSRALSLGEAVEVSGFAEPGAWSPRPDPELEVPVLFEDRDLIAVNKPAGVACHPLRPEELGTVASALIARYPEIARAGEVRREAGLVHRLDTSTSGVLVFARRRSAFRGLVAQLRGEGGARKRYDALVEGDATGLRVIDRPLVSRGRRVVALDEGREAPGQLSARTEVSPQIRLGAFTLVEAVIGAGRRHQIRAHLAWAGFPIAGDRLYGAALEVALERPFLHARQLRMRRPSSEEDLVITAPRPPELEALLSTLERTSGPS